MKKLTIFTFLLFIIFSIPVYANTQYRIDFYGGSNRYFYYVSENPIKTDGSKPYILGNYEYYEVVNGVTNLIVSGSKPEYQAAERIINEIVSSSHDIYHINGTVFFSNPRGIQAVVQKIPVMDKLIHPIRGILPFLIPLLVLLVAFWKGWQFLLQQLRTA